MMKSRIRPVGAIGVVPVGQVPEIAPRVVAAHISGYMGIHAEVLPPLMSPVYAYDPNRRQFDAACILDAIGRTPPSGFEKIIGVLVVDLFVPVFTHVFGEAQLGGRIALVSLFRLKTGPDDALSLSARALERAAKVALHETGHLFDLMHCEDRHCLMHFTGILEALDQTPLYFCRYCSAFLKDALARGR